MKAFITHVASAEFPAAPDIAAMILDDKVLISRLTSTTGGQYGYDWVQPGQFSLVDLSQLSMSLRSSRSLTGGYLSVVLDAVDAAIRGYGLQAIEEYEETFEKK